MWRPDDWDKIKPWHTGDRSDRPLQLFNRGVEAGADAMLEALRKDAPIMTPEQMKLLAPDRQYPYGHLIFIPDEKDGEAEDKTQPISR